MVCTVTWYVVRWFIYIWSVLKVLISVFVTGWDNCNYICLFGIIVRSEIELVLGSFHLKRVDRVENNNRNYFLQKSLNLGGVFQNFGNVKVVKTLRNLFGGLWYFVCDCMADGLWKFGICLMTIGPIWSWLFGTNFGLS